MKTVLIVGIVLGLFIAGRYVIRRNNRSAKAIAADNEFMQYGRTVAEVLSHRADTQDWKLDANIGFLLLNKVEKKGIGSLSQAERNIYVLEGMIREVNNGGFQQFFYNSAGDLAADLVPALTAIQSNEAKSIAEKAMAIFGNPLSIDREQRIERLQCITDRLGSDPWEDCDDAFYEISEPLETIMLDYIEKNLKQFRSGSI